MVAWTIRSSGFAPGTTLVMAMSFSRKLNGISLKLKFFPSSGSDRRTFHNDYKETGNRLKILRLFEVFQMQLAVQ